MAFFPNAFKQVFIANTSNLQTTGKTEDLTAENYGFFDATTWEAVPPTAADFKQHPNVVFAMANRQLSDTIGTHGGYQETIKSKPLDPRYIHRFYKVYGKSPGIQEVYLGYVPGLPATTPKFKRGKEYLLRIDVKGSAALRTFGRNLYHTFDARTGCLDECIAPCAPAATVDPVVILLQWAEQIKADPMFSQFILPTVYIESEYLLNAVDKETYVEQTDPVAISQINATLSLTTAYVDTRFGTCSFDPRDHFELEPLVIYPSLVDENGNPCDTPYLHHTINQVPRTAEGSGQQLVRDLILFNRYRQEPFQIDPRRREIEGSEVNTLNRVNPQGFYDSYYILYSVPRHSNPTSTHDADQYVLQVSVSAGQYLNEFEDWVHLYLASAGSPVKLETVSSPF